ncbi:MULTISPECIES: hypothetical protein [Pseudomonas]|uniref:DUF4156 domain-containing protein n=1 Tax=Pseudomonas sp. Hg7Tf TaxID=3236988 RepID=A0AB39I5Q4_9PSED|nr:MULTISPECIES: hypothetical protein [Pseudomonas]KJK06960.1 hypothetical protein UB47_13915 [Pseudomonas sp. 5]MDD1979064.1 DUF4156 domain-containing protein [Pseudomonas putida]MDH2561879.1 hypothetical protein [Pseudomonas sp. Hg5Tf]QYX49015.1 DUF4156 domain-containing protein [Pseudomonas sp. S11A 273]
MLKAPLTVTLCIAAVLLGGCSTQLTEAGAKVSLVTAASSEHCNLLQMFTVQGSDPDETLRMAFNRAADLGADSMAVANGEENTDGAKIEGAALRCRA